MSELTVTIKYGKGYEESWAVFRGETAEAVHQTIIDYFGLSEETAWDMPLHDLVLEVTKIAHGTSGVSSLLGGSVIQQGSHSTTPPWVEPKSDKPDPWEAAKQAAEEEVHPLRAAINDSTTLDGLYAIWADHQAELSADPELLSAWKAKGKTLKGAAA